MNLDHTKVTVVSFLKPYLATRKIIIFGFLLTMFLATIETGLESYFFKLVVDTVSNVGSTELLNAILWPAIFYCGMSLYHNLVMRAYHWGMIAFYPGLKQEVMKDLFAYSTRHSISFFQSNLAGDIAAKVQDVTESLELLLRNVFEIYIARIFQPIVVACFLAYINWMFSAIFILWTVLFVVITIRLSRNVGLSSHKFSQDKNQLSGKLIDILGNIITTKIFGRVQHEYESINHSLEKVKVSEQKMHWSITRLHFVQGILSLIIITLFLSLLIHLRIEQAVSIGDFVFVLTLLASNLAHVYMLGEGIGESSKNLAKFKQAVALLLLPHDVKDKPDASPLIVTQGTIEFKSIDFQFLEDQPLFTGFNLRIQAGEKVGIVGKSGAGKSTLVNLLLRLIEPTNGTVQIDGINIKDVTLNSIRNQITLVPQQIDLFHRSILDNIRYGSLDASDAEVIEAAKLAECDSFISEMPEGYQTLVGERGMKLSGGQKQRLAIARAYIKSAKILILDEATSALDSITEAYIQRALAKIMQDKTTIIIAHRLATLRQMDRILVMEKGKIVQEGTLKELINQPGHFQDLWQQQYFTDAE